MTTDVATLFDTSIASSNIGDYIIMDAVNKHSRSIRPDLQRIALPTHDTIGRVGRQALARSVFSLIGGTNLLSSHLRQYRQWKFSLLDLPFLKNAVLMGVGWWQYQSHPDLLSASFYRRVLSKEHIHSVRDSYTENQLASVGIKNVLNTGCPTLWDLTPSHCASIPKFRSDKVIFTITDYKPNKARDAHLVSQLLSAYREVFFWPQGAGDVQYLKSLDVQSSQRICHLPANLHSFDTALISGEADYIGTRLHAGIRALQKGVRSWIIAVDNRAAEKQKDFGVPVVAEDRLKDLSEFIHSERATVINLPWDKINAWKSQPGFAFEVK